MFRADDKVRCIMSGGLPSLVDGNIYTVKALIRADLLTLYEVPGEYSIKRFELVDPSLTITLVCVQHLHDTTNSNMWHQKAKKALEELAAMGVKPSNAT